MFGLIRYAWKNERGLMHALDDYSQADVHHWLYAFGSV